MNLYQHQIDGLKQTEGHASCALYWDMGLGKTFGGSEKMMEYGNRVNLVICQKSKINDWLEHFRTYYPIAAYNLTLSGMLDIFMGAGNERVGVINYELAWRRRDLLRLSGFTLLLDESSLIQNKAAKQTKFILELKPKNVILLSGTPTAGKYENLWTQAHLLGWGISESVYNAQYVNWKTIEEDGFFHKIVDMENPYKNVERLKKKFRDHGAVFMKSEEVFDLPEQNFTNVKVATSPEYKRFMRDSYIRLDDGTELIGDQAFSKRMYARQLCGHYSKAKLEAFRELIQSTNDRVVVFYNFTAELMELEAILTDLGRPFSLVNGTCKRLTEYEQLDDSITLIQYQAGSMGLNLQKANKLIYFTLPERSDLFEQSKARIHRIGQERLCFYWILTCTGSVEEKIQETLEQRRDFTEELFREVDHG